MKLNQNEKRSAVIATLKTATKGMTLAEISAATGMEIKSGTTNAMVKAGALIVSGERTLVCPTCGRKHTVKEYSLGDLSAFENNEK